MVVSIYVEDSYKKVTKQLSVGKYEVIDSNGNSVPCFLKVVKAGNFLGQIEYEIYFLARDVPSIGYKTYYL